MLKEKGTIHGEISFNHDHTYIRLLYAPDQWLTEGIQPPDQWLTEGIQPPVVLGASVGAAAWSASSLLFVDSLAGYSFNYSKYDKTKTRKILALKGESSGNSTGNDLLFVL